MKKINSKKPRWDRFKKFGSKVSKKFEKMGKRAKRIIKDHFPDRIWSKAHEGKKGRRF
jgi:hypothetical protein